MHWLLDLFLLALLLLFMVDKLTFLWVRRVYDLVYRLMVWSNGHLIFIDIDNFKQFNDRYSHKTGDRILRKIGLILLAESRLRAFRYGGDELAILLPWGNKEKARQIAERVRVKIEKANIWGLGVTVSCAIAKYEEFADKVLKEAKEKGKNRVITAK